MRESGMDRKMRKEEGSCRSSSQSGVPGGGSSGLQGRSCVCHDQIHIFCDLIIDDGSASSAIACSNAFLEGNLAGQSFVQSIFKALGSSIQCIVGNQLADTDNIGAISSTGLYTAGYHAHNHQKG